MDDFINGGPLPKWAEEFRKDNEHLLTKDGRFFAFGPDKPLTIRGHADSTTCPIHGEPVGGNGNGCKICEALIRRQTTDNTPDNPAERE